MKRSHPWKLYKDGKFAHTYWEGVPAVLSFHTKWGAEQLARIEPRFQGYKAVNVDSIWWKLQSFARGLTKRKT